MGDKGRERVERGREREMEKEVGREGGKKKYIEIKSWRERKEEGGYEIVQRWREREMQFEGGEREVDGDL